MPDTLSINEFAAKIKERRPDLAHIPDGTLVGKMLAAEPSLKPLVRMEYSDARGAELKQPALRDQAANFPSSQELGAGGAGVQTPWYARFFPAAGEAFGAVTMPVHSPREFIRQGGNLVEQIPNMPLLPKHAKDILPGITDKIAEGDYASAAGNVMGTAAGMGALGAVGEAIAAPPTPLEKTAVQGAKGVLNRIKGLRTPKPLTSPEVNAWMEVSPKQMQHGADPGARILSEDLLGDTKEATAANVRSNLTATGKEMETALYDATLNGAQPFDATPFVDRALKSAVKKYGSPKESTFTANLEGLRSDILSDNPNISQLTPKQAQDFQVKLGDSIDWHSTVENPINDAKIEIYRDLRNARLLQTPELEPLLSKWQDLYVADKSLSQSLIKNAAGKGTEGITPRNQSGFDRMKAVAKKGGKLVGKAALTGAGLGAGYKVLRDLEP